jgi:hypothetical protein
LYIYANNNHTNVVYSSSNTGCNYYGVANAPVARTTNIASDETSHQQNIPLWVGSLITGASSIHGLVDSISSYLAGTADGLLSYIGASKLNSFQGVVVLGIIAGTILIAVLSDAADNWWESKKEEWFS